MCRLHLCLPYDLKFVKDLPGFFSQLKGLRQLTLEKHEFSAFPELGMQCSLWPSESLFFFLVFLVFFFLTLVVSVRNVGGPGRTLYER